LYTVAWIGAALAQQPGADRLALGQKIFEAACKSCHDTGKPSNDGPQLSDGDDWRERMGGKRSNLYETAVQGVTRYFVMPPKGGNVSLSDDEVKAAVDYILERAGVR
jgi:cytochrome c5